MQPKIVRAAAIQRASSEKSGFSTCDAKVTGGTKSGTGSYDGIHGEINALEEYLSNGGTIAGIEKIVISSAPCKYCNLILSDLGIRSKVVSPDGVGRCQGGSYGWFKSEGLVSKALQTASGKSERDYTKWVSDRLKGG